VKTREQIAEMTDKVAVLENRSSSSRTGRSRPFMTCCRPREGRVQQGKPMLIVAEDIDGEAVATLVVNKLRDIVRAPTVKAGFRRSA